MTEVLRYAAFTADPAGGNPAGVVLDATGLAPLLAQPLTLRLSASGVPEALALRAEGDLGALAGKLAELAPQHLDLRGAAREGPPQPRGGVARGGVVDVGDGTVDDGVVAGVALVDPGLRRGELGPLAPRRAGRHRLGAALGLGPNAQKVYSAVRTQFPDMTNIGGYRAGDPGDHGSGNAVDIMVTGSRGDQVASWLQANAGQLNIKYIIWKQRIWMPGGSWKPMEDRGDPTQNHFDHVHVSLRE